VISSSFSAHTGLAMLHSSKECLQLSTAALQMGQTAFDAIFLLYRTSPVGKDERARRHVNVLSFDETLREASLVKVGN
jgi:hypothetical protein